MFAKFREKSSKSVENSMKNVEKIMIFAEFWPNVRKSFTKFCSNFEMGAVQRIANLVDLDKCLKNEYLVAKIGFDTEGNEPSKVCSFSLKNAEFYCIESFN